jgi:hypothetical protein
VSHLLPPERALYEDLCSSAHGDKVRFEQEFVPYDRVQQVLGPAAAEDSVTLHEPSGFSRRRSGRFG